MTPQELFKKFNDTFTIDEVNKDKELQMLYAFLSTGLRIRSPKITALISKHLGIELEPLSNLKS